MCYKENGMEYSSMWNDSAVYYSDRKTPYINSDKELTTEEIDQTAKVFGKTTGATLYTTKSGENGVSYQLHVVMTVRLQQLVNTGCCSLFCVYEKIKHLNFSRLFFCPKEFCCLSFFAHHLLRISWWY